MDFRNAIYTRLIIVLLVIQAVCGTLLLSFNPLSQAGQARFALVLGMDLVALYLVVYLYNTVKMNDPVNGYMVGGGFAFIAFLIAAGYLLIP